MGFAEKEEFIFTRIVRFEMGKQVQAGFFILAVEFFFDRTVLSARNGNIKKRSNIINPALDGRKFLLYEKKYRINRTRMTRMTRIFADKKD
ncbi:MAG: hypothetical protein KDE62_08520 [Calditrichaeota bacterium]|nr:hypothetical protein [Calditrichota bacterium]